MTVTAVSFADIFPTVPEIGGISTPLNPFVRAHSTMFGTSTMSLSGPELITGIRIRRSAPTASTNIAAWPSLAAVYASYIVKIGTSNLLTTDGEYLSSTPTIDSYFDTGDAVVGRSGGLTIAANTFTGSSSVLDIMFTTSFVYDGTKALQVAVSHGVYTGGAPSGVNNFASVGAYVPFVSDAISNTTGLFTSSNSFSNPIRYELISSPVPEPATMTAIALGLAAIARRKKVS